jgi:DNA (cytosine-5)-methyltransferase 1
VRYISLFSGIEAASVAWAPLGWEPLAFCEIDEFPSAVLAHRFRDVENLGDITKVDWKEVIARHGRPDVVVGGSPCQSFSIAGGRESLDGESRLMWEYVRAVRDLRPRWLLWENVPGCLSTRDDAFGCLLDALQECGYVDLAWRVLDAQFFGVAQRRRRVFLVGHLGEGGSAAAVLFESESLRGYNPSSRQKREALARAAGRGAASGCGDGCFAQNTRNEVRLQGGDGSVTWPIAASDSAKGQGIPFVMATGQANAEVTEDMTPTLNCAHEQPIVMDRAAFNQGANAAYPPRIERSEVMSAMVARGPHAIAYKRQTDET